MFYFHNTRKPDFSSIKNLDYNAYWRSRGFSINKKLKEREVVALETIPTSSKVLDIGCGNSKLPLMLKDKGCQVKVADLSEVVLEGFSKFGIKSVQLDLEKTKTISFEEQFDYIILSEVLEHTRNPEDILKTLATYTEHFFITVPNSAFYRYRLHLLFFGRFFTQWVYHPSEHLRFWSHKDFMDWLRALDFEIEFTQSSNGLSLFGLPFYKWLPNIFGHQICYLIKPKK